MSNKTRDVVKILFSNFFNSFRPRQIRGTFIGEDHFGNKFYEIKASPTTGKRKTSRWFEPKEKEDFQQEMPAEWEAWLRGRRQIPPTTEEIVKNFTIMKMKKHNAKLLDQKYATEQPVNELEKEEKGSSSFPKYDEYEVMPGEQRKENEK